MTTTVTTDGFNDDAGYVDCSDAEVGIERKGRNGKRFAKKSVGEINDLLAQQDFAALQTVCTSGISNMTAIFENSTVFEYDIFAFDMKEVNVSEAFAQVHFPEDLFHVCLPLMNQSQYDEIIALGNIEQGRDWVFSKAAQRTCDCLFDPNLCKNGGECFDKTFVSAGETSYSCVCTTGFTGPNCEERKREFLERTFILEFKGVQIVNTTQVLNDLKFVIAESLQVHPSQIEVSISYEPQNTTFRRRRNANNNATVIVEVTKETTKEALTQAAETLKNTTAPFRDSGVFVKQAFIDGGGSSDSLGLIIGLSVGGFVLIAVAAAVYRKRSKKASGYVGFTS